jgi:hypothetical protein
MKRHVQTAIALGATLLIGATARAQPAPVQPAPAPQPVVVFMPTAEPPPPASMSDVPVDDEGQQWRVPLFTSGAVVFLGSYGASVIVAGTSDHNGDSQLYIPVLGPWLDLSERGSCADTMGSCDHATTNKILLAADGIFQAAGLLAMLDGIILQSGHHTTALEARREYKRIHVTPASMGAASPGFAVMGHF